MQKLLPFATFTLAILSITTFTYSLSIHPTTSSVSFLSVGQGDAIVIDAGNGNQLLIDSGRDARVIEELGKVMRYGDKNIEVALATHYDFDHIGGFDEILDNYSIEHFLISNAPFSNKASEQLLGSLEKKHVSIGIVGSQSFINLGNGVFVDILYPLSGTQNQKGNDGSVIAKVYTHNATYMLTGDASSKIENVLVNRYGDKLKSDVLKLGHHGSKTSSSELFIKTVDPDIAIISAGENNQYGHPHKEVLDRLKKLDILYIDTFRELIKL